MKKQPFRFLVVEDNSRLATNLREVLMELQPDHFHEACLREYYVDIAANQAEADAFVAKGAYDMFLVDLRYPVSSEPLTDDDESYAGMNWLPILHETFPRIPVVVQTAYPGDKNFSLVVNAIKRGWAKDFVPKGTPEKELGIRLRKAWQDSRRDRQVDHITEELWRLMRSRLMRVAFDDMSDASGRARLKLANVATRLDTTGCAEVGEEIRRVSESLQVSVNSLETSVFEEDPGPVRENLNSWLSQEFLPLFYRLYEDRGKRLIHVSKDEVANATFRSSDMKAIFFELLINSLTMMDDSSDHLGTETRITVSQDGDTIVIGIEDNGPGISELERERVFEPRFTSRRKPGRAGQHHGHGLYLVRRLLWNMGSDIAVQAAVSYHRGTLVTITLRPV